MAVIKAENKNKKAKKAQENIVQEASLDAQERLVEILNDSPRIASLAGTEYEVRALRMGTQYLIAQEVIKINKAESATFGDIVKQFSVNIPSVVKVIVLCLLNDKKRIFKDGIEAHGYSQEYEALYDTLMWEGNINEYGMLLLECLQLLDVSVFINVLDTLSLFKTMVTKKREMIKGQK
jgi:hypothetical protein